MNSPYANLAETEWLDKTKELIANLPFTQEEVVGIVLECWNDIFKSSFGERGYKIGVHIFPKPQIIGFLLHELIPLEFAARMNNEWRVDKTSRDKDLVYIKNPSLSIEIKTSSHPSQIFGNRSYAQAVTEGKKDKAGYYLTVNFGKFKSRDSMPYITQICLGWLDHSDWKGQTPQTGQQASISKSAQRFKLIKLYAKSAD